MASRAVWSSAASVVAVVVWACSAVIAVSMVPRLALVAAAKFVIAVSIISFSSSKSCKVMGLSLDSEQ